MASFASALSWRSNGSLLDAWGRRSIMGRPMSRPEALAVAGALLGAALFVSARVRLR